MDGKIGALLTTVKLFNFALREIHAAEDCRVAGNGLQFHSHQLSPPIPCFTLFARTYSEICLQEIFHNSEATCPWKGCVWLLSLTMIRVLEPELAILGSSLQKLICHCCLRLKFGNLMGLSWGFSACFSCVLGCSERSVFRWARFKCSLLFPLLWATSCC